MARPRFVAARDTQLKVSISDTETTEIVLESLVDTRGNAISMSDFGASSPVGFCTINPKTENEEIIKFTDFTVNIDGSVTLNDGIERNCLPQPPYTATGTGSAHTAGSVVVISNNPQIYEQIFDYIDDIALSGAPDASPTAKGIVEIATTAEIDAGTQLGSTGAYLGVGPAALATSIYGTRLPSAGEKQALAGGASFGTPATGNKYTTETYLNNNSSSGSSDQSQTTQNGTSTVGESNTTGLRNRLAQSFTAGKTSIRGFALHKAADTGTFTGTVTVALQADTAGNPSGSNLASVTFTNAQWLALSVGEFEAIFASEYTSLTVGTLYWIVISTSTSDTSNRPNIGINTAGGYAGGSVKYNNTADGWVAVATVDLYFKTLEGIVDKFVKTNPTTGKIDADMLDVPQKFYINTTNVAATTSSAVVDTIPIPGSTLAVGKNIRIISSYQITSSTGSDRNLDIALTYGSSTVTIRCGNDAVSTTGYIKYIVDIVAVTTSSQLVNVSIVGPAAQNATQFSLTKSAGAAWSEDATVSKNIVITADLDPSATNFAVDRKFTYAELI